MEQVTRSYVARVNRTNGDVTYINVNNFNGLPSAQANLDDGRGFEERKDARALMNALNQVNKAINGNYEYYEIVRNETTNPITDGLSEEAKQWFETPNEEEPAEGEEPVNEEEPTPE